MINQHVGRYRITGVIGRGGMATVYKAYDDRFAREVAIKMLHQNTLDGDTEDTTRSKFAQEARIIAALEHHAIVPVYDYGEHDGSPYLVMRLMVGGSLKERLAGNRLTIEETAVILNRICAALDKAHTNHIVHRDIKPANILFDEDGMAYLADFGIARLTDHTQTTTIIGSPRYMAPEQAQGQPLGPQTDVYQMGVVLFHMLTGRVPFDGETTESILYQHIYGQVPLLIEMNPNLPPRCDGVIGYALAKKADERYATAGELAKAYNQATGQTAVSVSATTPRAMAAPPPPRPSNEATYTIPPAPLSHAQPAPAPASTAAPRRSLWGWIIGVGIAAVVLLVCGVVLVALNSEAGAGWLAALFPPMEPTAVVSTSTASQTEAEAEAGTEPEVTVPATAEGAAPVPTVTLAAGGTTAPEGIVVALTAEEMAALGGGTGRIAYAAERDGNVDIYISNPDGSERRLTNHSGDDYRPVWSADGSRIAYHSLRDTWEIYVMNADGSGQTNLTRHPADDSFPQWSPDGSQILFHSNRNSTPVVQFDIFVMNADGSDVRQLTTSEDNETGASWSADGTQIAFQRKLSDGREQIFVMDADGGNVVQLTSGSSDSLYPVWSPDGERLLFHSNRTGGWSIFSMAADGSDVRQVSGNSTADFFAGWSTNGEWVIYHSNIGDGNRDLFMTRADGSETVRLTETEEEERMPSWQN